MRGVSIIILCVWEVLEIEVFYLEFWLDIIKYFELDVIDEEVWF